jgi:hypothetical protein
MVRTIARSSLAWAMSQAGMPPTQSAPPVRPEHMSSARLFVGDVMIAFQVLNEVRHRVVTRSLGVSREHSNLVTLFVIAAIAGALRRTAAAPRTRVRKVRSSPTAVGDTMIAVSAAKETLDSVAGHPSRDMSSAAALIAFAVVAHSFRPVVELSLRAVRQSLRELIAEARRVRDVMRRWGIPRSNI